MSDVTNKLSIEDLFSIQHERLQLKWIAGKRGAKNTIVRENIITAKTSNAKKKEATSKKEKENENIPSDLSLIGHLNLIHPQQIQIIGSMEIKYLEGLRDISMQDVIKEIFSGQTACIIISDNCNVPELLKNKSNEYDIPLCCTPVNGNKLADALHYYLTNLFADMLTLHGVYMEVMAIGVLITGASGIGKSELALELISRGHRLIADDAPQFSKIAPDIINGTCPKSLQDFLEVRGLGILNVRELFGDSAIKKINI